MELARIQVGSATAETDSPKPSIDSLPPLNLMNLPDRLDNSCLAMVQAMADAALPPLPSCPERHLLQCIRIMQATLPKRAMDDVSGELVVAAYRRKLGHFSQDAISFLADKALELQWFPTIFECLAILEKFERNDHWHRLRLRARRLARGEMMERQTECATATPPLPPMTQADVDGMEGYLQDLGIAAGWLKRDDTGRVLLVPIGAEA